MYKCHTTSTARVQLQCTLSLVLDIHIVGNFIRTLDCSFNMTSLYTSRLLPRKQYYPPHSLVSSETVPEVGAQLRKICNEKLKTFYKSIMRNNNVVKWVLVTVGRKPIK